MNYNWIVFFYSNTILMDSVLCNQFLGMRFDSVWGLSQANAGLQKKHLKIDANINILFSIGVDL